LLLVENSRRN